MLEKDITQSYKGSNPLGWCEERSNRFGKNTESPSEVRRKARVCLIITDNLKLMFIAKGCEVQGFCKTTWIYS
jgi:lipid-binding SYLF domain-containing protein